MDQDKEFNQSDREIKRHTDRLNKKMDKDTDKYVKSFSNKINKVYKSLADKQAEFLSSANKKFNDSFKKAQDSFFNDKNSSMYEYMNKFEDFNKNVTSKLKSQDKLWSQVFDDNRKKDFTRMAKNASDAFSKILDSGKKMTDGLNDKIQSVTESLRDWTVALNVDKLSDKIEDMTKSMREYRIEMNKKGIDNDKFDRLKGYATEASKKSGYAVDKAEMMDAYSAIIDKGYKSDDDIKMYGELYQKFKYLGGDIDGFRELIDTFKQSGFGGADGLKELTSEIGELQNSDLGVSVETLSQMLSEYSQGNGGFRALANGNKSLYDKYTRGAMAITSSASSNGMDGLDKALFNIMKLDPESLADMASQNNAGWLVEVQKQMRSGDMKAAAANFLENYNKQRAQMLQSGGQEAWQTFSKEMDWGDLREDQIADQAHINAFMSDIDTATDIIDNERQATNKYMDTMEQQTTVLDKLDNYIKANPITSKLADFFDETDVSLTEWLLIVNQGSAVFGKIKGSLGKGLEKLADFSGDILGGSKIADKIKGTGKLAKGARFLGKIAPLAGVLTAAPTVAEGVSQLSSDDREEQWKGGTKLALTGIGTGVGALLGGPVGASIGASLGSFIADAVGDDLGPALMHGWDNATEFLSNLGDSLSTIASEFWDGFTDLGSKAFDFTKGLVKDYIYLVIGLHDMAFEKIFDLLGLDWGQFKQDVVQSIQNFSTLVTDTISSTYEFITGVWDNIVTYASNSWDVIYNYGVSIWNNIEDFVSGVWTNIANVGSAAFQALGNLAVSIFGKVKEAFQNSPLGLLASGIVSIGNKIADVISQSYDRGKEAVDGSHKTGLTTVPFDGYIAELHKDEMVLTADQANQVRDAAGTPQSFFDNVYKSALSNYDKQAMIASYQASVANKGGGGNGSYSNLSSADKLGIWKFFRGVGYSKEATAGLMGNLFVESAGTLNPGIIQNNGAGPAAGIAQWENYNTKSDRWESLANYASSKGTAWNDLQTQLEFIDKEMQGADPTTLSILDSDYGGYTGFKNMNTVSGATNAFLAAFERAGVSAEDARLSAATDFFNEFSQYEQGTPWVPNDQIALLHQGEMVVPRDNNPYDSSSSQSTGSTLEDVIDTLKWGVSRLESAIRESSSDSYNLSDSQSSSTPSESSSVFRFANF